MIALNHKNGWPVGAGLLCAAEFLFFVILVPTSGAAEAVTIIPSAQSELKKLTLEELVGVEVTSVSKKTERLSEAASAVYVITQEEIHRSGVTSIPEALRLAPGVQVGQVDAHTWAVSARGFNDVFANKLLVLQDGRSIYTPLFSGVFWDVQDTLLEDIDRIEVIRGPGATLWGANAVNGVINIVTKPARQTQGWLLAGGGGTEDRAIGGVRYGGKLGEQAHFRIYGKYRDHDDSVVPSGTDADDAWYMARGGARFDWEPSENNLIMIQGDGYGGALTEVYTVGPSALAPSGAITNDNQVRGGNILGRWTHTLAADSDWKLQFYYDRTTRDTAIFKEDRDTFDVDFQHRFPLNQRNDVVWGAGYRLSADDIGTNLFVSTMPGERTIQLLNAFVQDEITVVPDLFRFTLGTKFEHNDFTGWEVQPGARVIWTPHERHSIWTAVSRAVRTPSRAEDDIRFSEPTPIPGVSATLAGNRNFDSEKLIAYELGYRVQPHKRAFLDVATFYHDYDDLRTIEPVSLAPPRFTAGNRLEGEAYGFEIASSWLAFDWWRLQGTYGFLEMQLHRHADSGDLTAEADEGRNPHHQFTLRSLMDFPGRVQLDGALRYVDNLPALGIGNYLELDLRLAWRPISNVEVSIVGRNLLDPQHPEFTSSLIQTQFTEVQRSVFGMITVRF